MKRKTDPTQRDLLQALPTLRLLIKEVGGNYLAGLQSTAARLEQAVRAAVVAGGASRSQRTQMAAMLRLINELDVKPEKGRRRDLKELEKLIGKLEETMEDW